MDEEQLNSLAEIYRTSGCQRSYEMLYRSLTRLATSNLRILKRSGYGDESDAQQLFDDTFNRVVESVECISVTRVLSNSLRNARLNFIRNEKRRRGPLVSLESRVCNEESAPTLESTLQSESDMVVMDVRGTSTERDALIKKKKAENLAVIDFLLESTTDSVTISLVTLMKDNQDVSFRTLAKALGTNAVTVSRKLRALSRHYDANRFGDIRDYLAV